MLASFVKHVSSSSVPLLRQGGSIQSGGVIFGCSRRCISHAAQSWGMIESCRTNQNQEAPSLSYKLTHASQTHTSCMARSFSTSPQKHQHKFPQTEQQGLQPIQYLTLNTLRDNPGAVKKHRRVGRGCGSSKGKTCGRGHKGQNARSGGGVRPTFEGGQTPLFKLLPKRGFKNARFKQEMLPLNVETIQNYIDMGRLTKLGTTEDPITMRDLVQAGIAKASRIKHGMKLLAKGKQRLTSPIHIEISRASEAAIRAVEAIPGGRVTTVHYNQLALRALLKPEKFKILPRRARPPPKLMGYYTDYEKRGYLSKEVQMRKLGWDMEDLTGLEQNKGETEGAKMETAEDNK